MVQEIITEKRKTEGKTEKGRRVSREKVGQQLVAINRLVSFISNAPRFGSVVVSMWCQMRY